ncbi:hypothetical protein NX02_29420 [Sphingomonas sanxanigenens DSM 19645 = NX02]|uniref:Uncharacterized protein n=1 Tax=Sphingomonas sanxanigenens DSM 19645 = NX02 TaxID=1123269 RepID=W0ACE4_9SPHN|nr:hypothetical protein NX02_19470 [Sphingomonas sanxanigenens DSM 19645 = NX02]AHE57448.1 hypothetical protein NX02_29420 [Sphingomonas sanxanigenens DSM 19645 = NX02]
MAEIGAASGSGFGSAAFFHFASVMAVTRDPRLRK